MSSFEDSPEADLGAPGKRDIWSADDDGNAQDQVGRDLRDSAETIRTLLHDAFQRLCRLDCDSPVTALVGQAVERFQQVHRDIDGLASNLGPRQAEGREDSPTRGPSR